MEIKTAEEIRDKRAIKYDYKNWNNAMHESLCPENLTDEAMKEYASQFIELAAERAEIKESNDPQEINEATTLVHNDYGDAYIIDKQSILSIKELINAEK